MPTKSAPPGSCVFMATCRQQSGRRIDISKPAELSAARSLKLHKPHCAAIP
jgi:hypothetical protein